VTAPLTLDLIERLREAAGGNRELDAALALHFGWMIYDDGMGVMDRWEDPDGKVGAGVPPPFSSSLDAALELVHRVLPGQATAVGDMAFDPPGKPWACIWTKGGSPKFHGEAPTAPLALLLALMMGLEKE